MVCVVAGTFAFCETVNVCGAYGGPVTTADGGETCMSPWVGVSESGVVGSACVPLGVMVAVKLDWVPGLKVAQLDSETVYAGSDGLVVTLTATGAECVAVHELLLTPSTDRP